MYVYAHAYLFNLYIYKNIRDTSIFRRFSTSMKRVYIHILTNIYICIHMHVYAHEYLYDLYIYKYTRDTSILRTGRFSTSLKRRPISAAFSCIRQSWYKFSKVSSAVVQILKNQHVSHSKSKN